MFKKVSKLEEVEKSLIRVPLGNNDAEEQRLINEKLRIVSQECDLKQIRSFESASKVFLTH